MLAVIQYDWGTSRDIRSSAEQHSLIWSNPIWYDNNIKLIQNVKTSLLLTHWKESRSLEFFTHLIIILHMNAQRPKKKIILIFQKTTTVTEVNNGALLTARSVHRSVLVSWFTVSSSIRRPSQTRRRSALLNLPTSSKHSVHVSRGRWLLQQLQTC